MTSQSEIIFCDIIENKFRSSLSQVEFFQHYGHSENSAKIFSAVLLTKVLNTIVAMAIVGNSAQHYCQILLGTVVIIAKVFIINAIVKIALSTILFIATIVLRFSATQPIDLDDITEQHKSDIMKEMEVWQTFGRSARVNLYHLMTSYGLHKIHIFMDIHS